MGKDGTKQAELEPVELEPVATVQDATEPNEVVRDSTLHTVSGATQERLWLEYINSRSKVPQRILSVTGIAAKNGGGSRIETEDAA